MVSQLEADFSVKGFYAGKNVLLSGCTGFLGKVILEKLFHSCPDIKNLYILVRKKRNKKPLDRIKNEILNSYNFSVLKRKIPNWMEIAEKKIIPVVGDLIVENLVMTDETRKQVTDNVNVIINSAASVNFDDPLQVALQINYFGC